MLMNRRGAVLGLVAATGLAACGSPQGAGNYQIPQPQEGQAQIVMYRPSAAIGGGLRFPMTVNGMSVGDMPSGTVLTQSVSPGDHVVSTNAPSVDGTSSVPVSVAAGETAFVKGEAVLGWPTYRPRLVVVPSSQGRSDVSRM